MEKRFKLFMIKYLIILLWKNDYYLFIYFFYFHKKKKNRFHSGFSKLEFDISVKFASLLCTHILSLYNNITKE